MNKYQVFKLTVDFNARCALFYAQTSLFFIMRTHTHTQRLQFVRSYRIKRKLCLVQIMCTMHLFGTYRFVSASVCDFQGFTNKIIVSTRKKGKYPNGALLLLVLCVVFIEIPKNKQKRTDQPTNLWLQRIIRKRPICTLHTAHT